jgi:hypothetical protein
MKFAVQLIGQADTLEKVAPCFQGDTVRIVRRDGDWFLESSAFDACINGGQVFPIADNILRLVHRISYLYAGLISPFEIGYVQPFNEDGVPLRRALRASARFNVYSAAGIEELQNSRGAQTLGSEAVDRAMTDQQFLAALSLIGEDELQWPHIYDILEFLDLEVIIKKKWATRKEVRRLRQTANHFRHLGRPKKNPLPPEPPSLNESRSCVLGLLKKWISHQT